MISTNITRMLDSRKIPYTALELPVEKLGAIETASVLNLPLSQIYKTIVIVRPRGKPILGVISGEHRIDLKAVASLINEKKVSIPTQNEAEALTGLEAGGISPLALFNKGFSTIIDQSAQDRTAFHISGGQRGLILRLNPRDLQIITHAQFAKITIKNS